MAYLTSAIARARNPSDGMKEASLPEEMSGEKDLQELTGQIERITYHDAESGYTVLRIQARGYSELVTAVGLMTAPAVGSILRLCGSWKKHPKFGVQFDIKEHTAEIPTSEEGIEKYLASGIIKGIGPSAAEKIVVKFGKKTINILDNEPERLLEVDGIGSKKAAVIRAAWAEQRGMRESLLFLQNNGIGIGLALRVFRHYGAASVQVLQENPYRLAVDVFGIGFSTADKIAAGIGFAKDSPFRIRAGVLHVVSELTREGHIYVPIERLTEAAAEILDVQNDVAETGIEAARLDGEIIVEWFSNGGNDECAVYLPAFHYAELYSAKNLCKLMNAHWNENYVNIDAVIPWVQRELGINLAELQIRALDIALRSKVMVITGGPGTGKTTIIKAILKIRGARGLRVMLAAPTGRAAKRMAEATGYEAKTIHRMLEFMGMGAAGEFLRDESNPLECDLLVIDEASMIDQILFHHLLKAVPREASVILVGDVNQLPSVGAGNVLGDIINSGVVPVARLSEIFRQARESMIIVNAHRINNGELPILDGEYGEDLKDFYFIHNDNPETALEIIKTLVAERIPKRFGFDPVDEVQVLSPMHRGLVGTQRLNAELKQALNTSKGARVVRLGVTYQEGDKVMQIRNNYLKDVYNGDIGRIFKVDGDEGVVVVRMDNGLVSYEFSELDELTHAYAISIHKSQGSEYPAVVIPVMTQHYVMLQRNLLYTGITRGKKLIVLVGSKKAIDIAVKNDKTRKRWTRLAERLRRALRV